MMRALQLAIVAIGWGIMVAAVVLFYVALFLYSVTVALYAFTHQAPGAFALLVLLLAFIGTTAYALVGVLASHFFRRSVTDQEGNEER